MNEDVCFAYLAIQRGLLSRDAAAEFADSVRYGGRSTFLTLPPAVEPSAVRITHSSMHMMNIGATWLD